MLAGLIGFVAIAPSAHEVGQTISHFATGADHATPAVIELTSVGWWMLLTVGVTVVLLVRARWTRLAPYAPALLAVLAAVDMLHFAHGYQPMGPPSKAIPPRTPAVRYLQRHTADGRVAGLGGTLFNDWTTVYGLRDVRGYDPPQPSLRFAHLWQRLAPGQPLWTPYEISTIDPSGLRLLSILGARYLVAGPGLRLESGRKGPFALLATAYSRSDATIFENRGALPRVMVARSVRVVDGEEGIRGALVDKGFDPQSQVLIERSEPGAVRLAAMAPGSGSVTVVHDANAEVHLRATLAHPGLVMLDDQSARGWTVRIDDRPARALRVDGVMRGVAVPAGTHSVVWNYTVPGLRLGLLLSGLGLVGILAWIATAGIMYRRRAATSLKVRWPVSGQP
jgi:hypothetical protein